ncbi:MAG: hypothetical protein AAF899_15215 [Pseudomonadota bacterium]
MDVTLLSGLPPSLVFWLQLLLPFLPLFSRRPMVLSVIILAVLAMQALIVLWAISVLAGITHDSDGPWVIVFGGIVALSIAMSVCIALGRVGGMLVASRLTGDMPRRRAEAIGDVVGVTALPAFVIVQTQLG